MKASSRCKSNSKSEFIRQSVTGQDGSGRKLFLPALIALGGGCGLLAGPGAALELGEIQVHSTLGQPLRASVAFALQPNEQIHDYCIYLQPGAATNGLPAVSSATIAVANGTIGITGRVAIREPLVSLQLTVDCPHSAHLRREYSVFLDPRLPAQVDAPLVRRASAPAAQRAPQRTAATTRAAVRPAPRPAISSTGTYRVQPGDSLSEIASRISGRSVGIWQAVDAIFEANAEAFIDNDKNLIRAGAVLAIPDSILASAGTGTGQAVTDATRNAATVDRSESTAMPTAGDSPAVSSVIVAPALTETGAIPEALQPPQVSEAAENARTRSGNAVPDSDNPFVTVPGADVDQAESTTFSAPIEVIPPTVVEAPSPTQTAPAVRTIPTATSDSWTLLMWLGGTGVALILALLLFGRRLKERFIPSYGATPALRRTDSVADDAHVSPVPHVSPGLPSQGVVARVVSLDADLEDGSGLQYGDVDVAQDFGFSPSGEFDSPLDIDLTSPSGATVDRSTDTNPPRRFAQGSILVSETPPRHEDTGEYDLSMILDATQEILDESEDATRDLRAVEVNTEEEDTVSQEYDVIREIDYKILEQDYEDELTATQTLNIELSRAARELSNQYGKDAMGDTLSDTTINEALDERMGDETTLLPSAGEAFAGDDETIAMPAAGEIPRTADATSHLAVSSNMSLDDTANEQIALAVPAADNDAAAEDDIETGTVDARKLRAS